MGDVFTELVVERKPQATDSLMKAALIAGAVLFAFAGLFFSPVCMAGVLLMFGIMYFVFPRLQVEYEYSYVNGVVDIAAVYSKQSRKELTEVNLTEAACVAPLHSHHLDSYGETYRVVDYSAKDASKKPYVAVEGGEKSRKVLLQLDDVMINDLKYRIPRTFFTD